MVSKGLKRRALWKDAASRRMCLDWAAVCGWKQQAAQWKHLRPNRPTYCTQHVAFAQKWLIRLQLAGLAALTLICFLSNSAILMKARGKLTTDSTGGSQLRWPRPPPCSSDPFSAAMRLRNLHSTDKQTTIWQLRTQNQNCSHPKSSWYYIYQSILRCSQS